jgi:hypothetical protein
MNSTIYLPGCGGLNIPITSPLVIVLVIDQHCVLSLKTKRKPPVAIHCDRPMVLKFALKSVQMPCGNASRNNPVKP